MAAWFLTRQQPRWLRSLGTSKYGRLVGNRIGLSLAASVGHSKISIDRTVRGSRLLERQHRLLTRRQQHRLVAKQHQPLTWQMQYRCSVDNTGRNGWSPVLTRKQHGLVSRQNIGQSLSLFGCPLGNSGKDWSLGNIGLEHRSESRSIIGLRHDAEAIGHLVSDVVVIHLKQHKC